MKLHFDHTFERTDIGRFVQTYFCEEFNRSIADAIGIRQWQRLEREELPDGSIKTRTRVVPKATLPPAVRRFAGNLSIEYDEISVFQPHLNRLDYTLEHVAEKYLQVAGTIRFLEVPGGVRRVLSGEVRVQIPALRMVIERVIRHELCKAYAQKAKVMQRYLDSQPVPEKNLR